jgi:hypothetical protein
MIYDNKYSLSKPIKSIGGVDGIDSSSAGKSFHIINALRGASLDTQVFIHKIVNKYCDQLSIHFKADSLFNTSGGNTETGSISM